MNTSAFGITHHSDISKSFLQQTGLARSGSKAKKYARLVGLSGIKSTEKGNKISRALLSRSKMNRLSSALKGEKI